MPPWPACWTKDGVSNEANRAQIARYLEHLEKAEYIRSYKQAATDKDVLTIAEEGMEDYLRQLEQ